MRAAGKLAALVLDKAAELVAPGATTESVDAALHALVVSRGAYPSPLNYGGFPKSVCTSVNEVICHGIPDDRALIRGDIVNVDVTVFLDGHHGDTSRMFFVGGESAASPEARALCAATKEALDAAISICAPGVPYRAIGDAISDVADKHGYGVVRDFIGHGVGKVFHAAPQVLHYRNREPGRMQLGSTFTIEPMLVESKNLRVKYWKDGWTATTVDGSLSAQYEHTLLVVEGGVEILTKA
jgi:methionyl aminopeptidase